MPVRPIVRLGHPTLRAPADAYSRDERDNPQLQALIDDMFETMDDAGGVGLAAPQIDIAKQIVVYSAVDPDAKADYEPERKVLINPALEPETREMVYDWEGCLSIPDIRGLVPRHAAVRVHALDRHGQRLDFTAEGYEARIVQHEFDHLNGILFLDRMRDLRSLCFVDEWLSYMTTDDDDGEGPPAV